MNGESDLNTARTLLAKWQESLSEPEPNRLDVTLPQIELLSAVKTLHEAGWGYLGAITGLDLGVETGTIEVLYHFCSGVATLTLRVHSPRVAASVPSICDMYAYAGLFEREFGEMFGITVIGTPDASRVFLPDDWPDGVFPLRKDARLDEILA